MHHELEKISRWTNTLNPKRSSRDFRQTPPDLPHPSGASYGSRQFIRIGLGISQQKTHMADSLSHFVYIGHPRLATKWYGKLSIMKIFGGTLW
jgi:hypothetical protein